MYFKNEREIAELVRGFETCELNPGDFRHYQHLAVALWYLKHFPYEEASDRMRGGIQRLAAAYGKSGYHETITRFWLKMVSRFLRTANSDATISELANLLADEYCNKNVIADYYSQETIASAKAKNEWVEPDLKALEPDRIEMQAIEIMA